MRTLTNDATVGASARGVGLAVSGAMVALG
jgi:hypothetical protein